MVNELHRPDIHAPRRLSGNQHPWLPIKFTRDNELLLVATGKLSRSHRQIAGINFIFLDRTFGGRLHLFRNQQTPAIERAAPLQTQQKILSDRTLEQKAFLLSVFGNHSHPEFPDPSSSPPSHILS